MCSGQRVSWRRASSSRVRRPLSWPFRHRLQGGTPSISAPPDVVVGEADGTVTLPVTLNQTSTSPVTVNYATASGSGGSETYCAYSNSVYEGTSGTLTFAPGTTTQNVTVNLLNCHASLSTGFYTFYLGLSSASGGTISRTTTQVDVTGDTPASSTPGLSIKNAVVDATAGTVKVPVVLGGPSGAAEGVSVTVAYATHDGSAKAGTDYTNTSGTLTFVPGETAQNITVPIIDPSGSEPTRNFSVSLSSPTNATIAVSTGTVTIGASGATPVTVPQIAAPADTVLGESDGYVDLPVTLSAPGINTVTVNYATGSGSGESETYCAYSNSVYQGESGTLTFAPGVTTQDVRVPLLNCNASQSTGFYTFYLGLSAASGGTIVPREHPDRRHRRHAGELDPGTLRERTPWSTPRVGTVSGPRAPRRALGCGPRGSRHRELRHRRRLGQGGHRLHPAQRHPDLPGRVRRHRTSPCPSSTPPVRSRPGASR